MSTLREFEKQKFEKLFRMKSGYVSDFTDASFSSLFQSVANIDIHSEKYRKHGNSKAKKLRAFWDLEDDELVVEILEEMLECWQSPIDGNELDEKLFYECKEILQRLSSKNSSLRQLKTNSVIRDSAHLSSLIKRIEENVSSDPDAAIGSSKEIIEAVCKTILELRGKPVAGTPDIPTLTKATLKELSLVPEDVDHSKRGAKAVERVLRSLGSIGNDLNELRGLYGTGHGKSANAKGLSARHARLAAGAAATFSNFLWETFEAKSGDEPT